MSVTLTDRDTATLTLNQASAQAEGVTYAVSGGTMADYKVAMARHQSMGVVSKNSRHNLRLERRKVNTAGVLRTLAVDITISIANDGTFAADDADDLLTAASSYFAAEADTGNFILGVNRT
jgi:protein involved in polysaccharide export with SLBB domain